MTRLCAATTAVAGGVGPLLGAALLPVAAGGVVLAPHAASTTDAAIAATAVIVRSIARAPRLVIQAQAAAASGSK